MPKVILAGERYVELVKDISRKLKTVKNYIALDGTEECWHYYGDLLKAASDEERFPTSDDEDLTVLVYTAGTTGFPKGVMLSYNSYHNHG